MEKLIELLNEYNCKVLKHTDKWKEKSGKLIMEIDYNHSRSFNSDLYICSLRYGFIKWLVENDKINLLQLDNRIALSMSIEFNKVERVLMALSISDTPIEDLILYLK